MRYAILGFLLMGCGAIPDSLTLGGMGVVPETRTCRDTTTVIGPSKVDTVVTTRECRTGDREWQW